MKIAHLVDYIGYVKGGVETQVRGLCINNNSSEHTFKIVTARDPFIKPDFSGIENFVETYIGLFGVREYSFILPGLISDFCFWLPVYVMKRSISKKLSFDLLHCHSFYIMQVLRELQCKLPIVLTIYNPVPKRNYIDLDYAHAIVFQSLSLLEETRKKIPALSTKFHYIPPGFNPELFNKYQHTDKSLEICRLLFIGRYRYFKNLENLLKSLHYLQKLQKFSLSIIAQGPLEKKYKYIAKKLDILHLLKFIPPYQYEKMGEVYSMHDAVIIPSWYESFCFVGLEALAARKKLLISERMEEFIRLFPFVKTCDPSSPEDIAQVISNIIEFQAPTYSKDIFDVFQWTKVLEVHYQLYEKTLMKKQEFLFDGNINTETDNTIFHKEYFKRKYL